MSCVWRTRISHENEIKHYDSTIIVLFDYYLLFSASAVWEKNKLTWGFEKFSRKFKRIIQW